MIPTQDFISDVTLASEDIDDHDNHDDHDHHNDNDGTQVKVETKK